MPPQKISGCLRSLQGCLKYSPPVLHFSSWDPVWSVFWIFLNFNLCWLSRHHEFLSFARLCAQNTHEFLISRTPFNYLKWQFIWRSQTINSHSFTQFFFFFFFYFKNTFCWFLREPLQGVCILTILTVGNTVEIYTVQRIQVHFLIK